MNRVEQKGTKPHQLLSNLTGQFNFFYENDCANIFANFIEFSAWYEANSMKFSKESAQTFFCKKVNAQLNLAIADVARFLSVKLGPIKVASANSLTIL